MSENNKEFVPAAGRKFLTPFYDRMISLMGNEDKWRNALINFSQLQPGFRVLDLGCGTGELSIRAKLSCPEASITGLDPDNQVLGRARQKARDSKAEITLINGYADELPQHPDFVPDHFDLVLSGLLFHHLMPEAKITVLRNVLMLLKPGGRLVMADWGEAKNLGMRLAFLSIQLLDGFATTRENVAGKLPQMMSETGFVEVGIPFSSNTRYGTFSFFTAQKPG